MIILRVNKKCRQAAWIVMCILVSFLTSCNFHGGQSQKGEGEPINNSDKNQTKDNEKTVEQGKEDSSGSVILDDIAKENTPNTQGETATGKDSKNKDSKTKPTNYAKKVNPFASWGNNEAMNQYWTKLRNVAQSASAYYIGYAEQAGLLSKGGKMYHSKSGEYVGIQYLCKNAGMDIQLIDFSCDVLLIKGSDLAAFSGAEVPSGARGFGVFTAARQPSGSKIMMSSPEGSVGMISEEDYRELLKGYSQQHGKVNELSSAGGEYQRILNFLRVYEGRYDQYFVRGIMADSKYAVVTLSSQGNPLNLKQYILVNNNNFWEVVVDGLEREINQPLAVNKKLPDFNLDMLPLFQIAANRNNLKADYSDVHKVMIYEGLIQDVAQIQYQCGTTKYCYIVLYSGEKFLATKKGDTWNVKSVSSSRQAFRIMQDEGAEALAFILWEE
jgi:hypothetical protein